MGISPPSPVPFLFRCVGWLLGVLLVAVITGGLAYGGWMLSGRQWLRMIVLYCVFVVLLGTAIGSWMRGEHYQRIFMPHWLASRPRLSVRYLYLRLWLYRWKPLIVIAALLMGAAALKYYNF